MLFFFSSCILKPDNLTLLPLGGDTVEPARLPYHIFFSFVFFTQIVTSLYSDECVLLKKKRAKVRLGSREWPLGRRYQMLWQLCGQIVSGNLDADEVHGERELVGVQHAILV